MKTLTIGKFIKRKLRALIRAVQAIDRRDALGYEMDSRFDGGEWSCSMHGPDACGKEVARVLTQLGLEPELAVKYLDIIAKCDRHPDRGGYNIADYTSAYVSEALLPPKPRAWSTWNGI